MIFPKKKLGQNFLVDKNIQKKIIAAAELKKDDIVLEIGAGRGELTRCIAQKVARVYALEIDRSLCDILKGNLKEYKNTVVINEDVLKFNLKRHFRGQARIKVMGNIPYYITTPIIERLFKFKDKINTVFFTVQKEFGRRMTAACGSKEYGSFSCFLQYYAQPKIIFIIKKNCFFPAPKVDSCFLRLDIRQKPPVKLKDEQLFFQIIRRAFNQRRKTLRNSLKGSVYASKLERFFREYRIDPNTRPERLSLKDFANLANL
ncbi:MAG: ribosomal RNA small subunit methyltransferase A [Candidatus Omnitrophica bacterium]|nr:ribosomal RNA small subunit methyltransferase A [Candidatus Omnitrophota bacterium]